MDDNDSSSERSSVAQHASLVSPMIASSQMETVFLAASGDVLQGRCRSSSYFPQRPSRKWEDEFAVICCDAQCDELTRQVEDSALLCSPWSHRNDEDDNNSHNEGQPRRGLLGGAPAQVVPMPQHQNYVQQRHPRRGSKGERNADSMQNRAQKAFRSPPFAAEGFDEESIVPIRSFDYSHFAEGGNDMLPPPNTVLLGKQKKYTQAARVVREVEITFFHGVPSFSRYFTQVKISQLSAHPLGSHVLLISDSGLLYSYGSNKFGQLGVGVRSNSRKRRQDNDYVPVPTIVTPLVENGGKSIVCAAGVSHSLVVVETEVRRLLKANAKNRLRNNPELSTTQEAVVHHQLYGFGRNDFMKIGLVSPKVAKPGSDEEMENVVLPRRVALRCKVRTDRSTATDSQTPAQGIFAIEASLDHSAALVRRASGEVELYTWGNAMSGALGLPQASLQSSEDVSAVRVVPVPSFVASLSRSANPHAKIACLLFPSEFPRSVSLGRQCSFVTTSEGRCFSFGSSNMGMLGLGTDESESHQPREVALPAASKHERFLAVRAGGSHVVATSESGRMFFWGAKRSVGLPVDKNDDTQWSPKILDLAHSVYESAEKVVQACPGHDNVFLISESGRVFSCGVASGRLCQGEVSEAVSKPKPVFGGLQLFRRSPNQS